MNPLRHISAAHQECARPIRIIVQQTPWMVMMIQFGIAIKVALVKFRLTSRGKGTSLASSSLVLRVAPAVLFSRRVPMGKLMDSCRERRRKQQCCSFSFDTTARYWKLGNIVADPSSNWPALKEVSFLEK